MSKKKQKTTAADHCVAEFMGRARAADKRWKQHDYVTPWGEATRLSIRAQHVVGNWFATRKEMEEAFTTLRIITLRGCGKAVQEELAEFAGFSYMPAQKGYWQKKFSLARSYESQAELDEALGKLQRSGI